MKVGSRVFLRLVTIRSRTEWKNSSISSRNTTRTTSTTTPIDSARTQKAPQRRGFLRFSQSELRLIRHDHGHRPLDGGNVQGGLHGLVSVPTINKRARDQGS